MRFETICLALVLCCAVVPAFAQNSTQAPAPDSHTFSGGSAAGDPSGAIRSLSRADSSSSSDKQIVKVPNLGGEAMERTGGVPYGTTGPGRR